MKIDTTTSNLINKINRDIKYITNKLGISECADKLQAKEAYILLKDHKPDFRAKSSTHLINPTRVGRISKTILERTNQSIKYTLRLLQWINTTDIIKWFSAIQNNDKIYVCTI